jgi:aspartyl-tRNA(Asn)/glutamyl-tRNA(Gln) amidotransferase subunit A
MQTLKQLSVQLKQKQVSATELAQSCLDRIAASDLNAFIGVNPEQTLAQAKAADAKIASGDAGELTGLPIAHKDIFVTRGWPSTAGSKMLSGYNSPFDASVVEQFRTAGMVMLGKLNCDEFAMGSSNENSFFGAVKNPWDKRAVPGGSSGGSAAAVAGGLTPAATGTDTGGSIRQPASFCGITGIKPTYGRASRYGMIAYASSLDQAGPMARSAEDCALLLSALCGPDLDRDSTSLDRPAEDFSVGLNHAIEGLRIGVPKEFFGDGLHAAHGVMHTEGFLEVADKDVHRRHVERIAPDEQRMEGQRKAQPFVLHPPRRMGIDRPVRPHHRESRQHLDQVPQLVHRPPSKVFEAEPITRLAVL